MTHGAAFGPVVSPLPSKGQLDSLQVDAFTLGGRNADQYLNKPLETAGGVVSLIVRGDRGSADAIAGLRL